MQNSHQTEQIFFMFVSVILSIGFLPNFSHLTAYQNKYCPA